MGVMDKRRQIALNEPHLETIDSPYICIPNFQTDMVGKLKMCRCAFLPERSGSGDPSPSNIRPISGRTGIDVYSAQEAYKLLPTSGTRWTDNGITVEHFGNGKYHVYGTTTGTAVGPFIYVDEFVIPSSDGRLFQIKNSVSLSSASIRLMYNQTIVETWDLSPANRSTSTYSGMQGKTVNGFVIRRSTGGDFDFTIEPTFTKNLRSTISMSWSSTGTFYRGNVNLATGELRITVGETQVKNLTWTTTSISTVFRSDSMVNHRTNDTYTMSEEYVTIGPTYGIASMPNYSIKSHETDPARMYIRDDRYTDPATFKNAQGESKILYGLAEPQVIWLTPEQVMTLRGANNIWSNANDYVAVQYWTH